MRIIGRRGCRGPVYTEAQVVDQILVECHTVLNTRILIPRQVKSRKSRHVGARRCSCVWRDRRTVIDGVTREDRMRIGKVVVDASHTVIFTGAAFVSRDQLTGSISIVRPVRGWHPIEKLLYLRIDRSGGTSARAGALAARRVASRRKEALMCKRIRYRSNCGGCLDLAKSFIVGKKERAIVLQRPSDSRAKLIANERRDRIVSQVKIVLGIERRIPMQFPQRSVKLVAA